MRIVAGRCKGRAIKAPRGLDVRPTSDRARESLFNILEHGIDWEGLMGANVLDLFCGTGALGLEALSRGAAKACFVDNSPASLRAAKENAAAVGEWRNVQTLKLDCARLPTPPRIAGAPCRVAFLDAPYEKGLTAPALDGLGRRGWIGDGALCVAEVAADEPLDPPKRYAILDERVQGAARLVFLRLGS